jgi:tRNA A37 threonylcarbamoyladenosine dehydratase
VNSLNLPGQADEVEGVNEAALVEPAVVIAQALTRPALAIEQALAEPATSVAAPAGLSVAAVGPACTREEAPRRFAGVARVFGGEGFVRLAASHVCIIGLGGVGSWAAEALARSGIGRLTLIDLDHVAESNINRQVLALDSTTGMAKVEAMRARIADIAPDCLVDIVDDFVTPENAAALVPVDALVIDAVDQVRAKAALVALCRTRGQRLLLCGGAGGRTDPLRLKREDLARTTGDALLASLRARLRREHDFPRKAGKRFGFEAIYSDEPMRGIPTAAPGAALNCAGYGSLVTVTAAMGLAAAARALELLQVERKVPVASRVASPAAEGEFRQAA